MTGLVSTTWAVVCFVSFQNIYIWQLKLFYSFYNNGHFLMVSQQQQAAASQTLTRRVRNTMIVTRR